MIKFNVRKPQIVTPSCIEQAKSEFLQKVGNIVLEELFIATSSKGPDAVGIKTGLLRKSLRLDITGNQVMVYFDPQVAAHAQYVLEGTKFIESKGILEKVIQRVQDSEAYRQARSKLLNMLGFKDAS